MIRRLISQGLRLANSNSKLKVQLLIQLNKQLFSECRTNSNSHPKVIETKQTANFKLQQIKTECLSEYSYMLESGSEAALIDPIRDPTEYIKMLEAGTTKLKLKYIFLTHFHADFVSGHHELNRLTGAEIVFGPSANPNFPFYSAKDSERLQLGDIEIEVLHTPGHTPESTSYVVIDQQKRHSIFTGDTLFLGEVGRPDLAVTGDISSQQMAYMLFDSLQRLKTIGDNVLVFPGHGAGSPCGKNIQNGNYSSIGDQLSTNYALQDGLSRSKFIEMVTANIQKPLDYFKQDVKMNKQSFDEFQDFEVVYEQVNKELGIQQVKEYLSNSDNNMLLDCRMELAEFWVKSSWYICSEGRFALECGQFIKQSCNIIVVGENQQKCQLSIKRLLRVGFHNILGYLSIDQLDLDMKNTVGDISVAKFNKLHEKQPDIQVLDVRTKMEQIDGVVKGSVLCSVQELQNALDNGLLQKQIQKKDEAVYVYCKSGYRANIAVPILGQYGYQKIVRIVGSYNKLEQDIDTQIQIPQF